jgi:hypothetical protein
VLASPAIAALLTGPRSASELPTYMSIMYRDSICWQNGQAFPYMRIKHRQCSGAPMFSRWSPPPVGILLSTSATSYAH